MDSLKDKVKDLERVEILHALDDCNWVMAKAARMLGITERMMGYKIRKYGIRKEGCPVHNSHQCVDCRSTCAANIDKIKNEGGRNEEICDRI